MIKRAEREGDPWSGHMAFPGGRMDKTDAHGYAVAVRETEEEVGLTLGPQDQCIGRLSDINARPHKGAFGMAVSPFVFRLEREVSFSPNYEVAEVVWVPLEFLLDTDNREKMVWEFKGASISMPCYFFGERRIWGLSLMMLDELMDLVEGKTPGANAGDVEPIVHHRAGRLGYPTLIRARGVFPAGLQQGSCVYLTCDIAGNQVQQYRRHLWFAHPAWRLNQVAGNHSRRSG